MLNNCRRLLKINGLTENIYGSTSRIQIFAKSTKKLKRHILQPNGFLPHHLNGSSLFVD
ncbi:MULTISPECIES: hypothetical protein [Chryseobacterium]|uniref:Uncharacterized protein n=1 Tax=Chryseobacterium geocarposphaerae TaxID=1416776 RepID=A0ABU1L9Y4_9FLAO|nr:MULTISPECIES: hypothetical protein [Chryseobacterium]MDR6403527.1 hypothetical protein [Chryseobacterium geocarposphaerae]MDR6697081.1 hypothetical protein [Chryseobacterium ginsenosidimutans]